MNIIFHVALGFLFFFGSSVYCQSPTPTPVKASVVEKNSHAILEEARQGGLEEFQKQEPATPEEYREYLQLLTQLTEADTLEDDWKRAAQTMQGQTTEVRQAIADFKPPEVSPEGGLGLFDSARIDGWLAGDWIEALQKIGATREQQAGNAFASLKNQQQKLQALESAGPAETPRDKWLLKLQETRVRATLAEHSQRSNNQSWQSDVDLQEALMQRAKLNASSLESRVSFPESVLQSKLDEIRHAEEDLGGTVAKVGKQLKNFSSDNATRGDKQVADLLLESMESQLQLLEYHRIGLLVTGQVWHTRHDLWNTTNATSIDQIARLVANRSQEAQTWQPLIPGLRAKLQERRRLASVASGGDHPQSPSRATEALDKALIQEEACLSQWENGFSRLIELIKLTRADIESRRKSLGFGEKMDAAAITLGAQARDFWDTEVFTLNDSVFVNGQIVRRPSSVTLGMLLIALAILLVGGMASAAFSRWLPSRLRDRFALDANTGAIVQKFTHMILVGVTCLIALAVVKIPLTIFALLGGGAAIALGFGAQQLVNNLISGLILLFERPIRIGDMIDVENFSGTVTAIGTRCCQLRRSDGVEILIPNSVLLQSTVVNWTLSDNHARQEFSIGIAHGSPVKKAIRIVHDIVAAHPNIQKGHEVNVFFHDFAKDSLVLRVFYWIDKTLPHTTNGVPSELRIAIYEAFLSEGIALAFPQRDVHLDSAMPLAIQIMPPPK